MTYKEIQTIAKALRMEEVVIDKDWILGHFLNAMFNFPDISKNFVFKGGTCLKKNYFEDYRFSEDLDFTLLDKKFVIDDQLFYKISKLTEENSGAKFHLKKINKQIHNDIAQGYEVTVLYWGAYHKPNQTVLPVNRWQTKIKLDISYSEEVILEPEKKSIFHSYSDKAIIQSIIPTYPLNEIVAEKLRSLIQRNRPRDIYDLYYLSEIIPFNSYKNILGLLKQKSDSKNINCCYFDDFINQKTYKSNKRAWESSLKYHLPAGQQVDYDIAYLKVEQFVMNILKQTL